MMSKKLVLYFSVYGTAKKTAEEIAKQTGADLLEIEPVAPYDGNRIITTRWRGWRKRNTMRICAPRFPRAARRGIILRLMICRMTGRLWSVFPRASNRSRKKRRTSRKLFRLYNSGKYKYKSNAGFGRVV